MPTRKGQAPVPLLSLLQLSHSQRHPSRKKKAHGKEDVQLLCLPEDVRIEGCPAGSRKDPHRSKTVQVPGLPQSVFTECQLGTPRKDSHGGKTAPVQNMWEGIQG
uniref:Putative secreted protein n=1 Tax=Ixodes ricinus TaxID=34613 RepID=A0A6B0UGI9_IXORI